jgi:Zn finger protein HypA/HybF involved in hydrogenase expression
MCNVCFWCASCIDIEKMATANAKCPYCDNPRLELTLITSNNSILEL